MEAMGIACRRGICVKPTNTISSVLGSPPATHAYCVAIRHLTDCSDGDRLGLVPHIKESLYLLFEVRIAKARAIIFAARNPPPAATL